MVSCAVRMTIRAGRSGSTYRKTSDVETIANAISHAGKSSNLNVNSQWMNM